MNVLLSSSLALLLAFCSSAAAQDEKKTTLDALKKRPITTAGGKVGDLLKQWWKEGTAAGNAGDFYDNRDGAHSDLDTKPFPQLERILYTPEEIKARIHWAAARTVRPGVVFGNSSTSAPPTMGGSNPRMYYISPMGLDLLHKQYVGNNLYMYPEHRDHDPGHNGPDDGFGDLYPTNTPYLVISQGSSGSDQPFMRAVPLTLAAFRPEVKAKLAETGLLMPTVQMILRATSKGLKDPKEYLSGKAHPTVFEGSQVDELAMIQMAHGITLEALPPMVQVRVLKEETPVHGRDYFEPLGREQLADTPSVIARFWRGKEKQRTLLVSAEKSFDLNKSGLKHHWVILRGDPKRIQIKPQNDEGSVAEIIVDYHERMPLSPGSGMASNRVDLGVFVHNGHYFSAPAFLTFFSLDSEARTYEEKGRILEIGYGIQETRLDVKDWAAFFGFLREESPRRQLFAATLASLTKEQKAGLTRLEEEYLPRWRERENLIALVKAMEARLAKVKMLKVDNTEDLKKLEAAKDKENLERLLKAIQELEQRQKQSEAELQKSRQELAKIDQGLRELVQQPLKGTPGSATSLVKGLLTSLRSQLSLLEGEAEAALKGKTEPARKKKLQTEKERLIHLAGGRFDDKGGYVGLDIGKGIDAPIKAPTRYQQAQEDRYLGVLLGEYVYPDFLQVRLFPHVVDQRLNTPRTWRDVYRFDTKGNYLGWTRFDAMGPKEFNRDGHLILEKDKLARCLKAEAVNYEVAGKRFGPSPDFSLRVQPTGTVFTYEYTSDEDVIGRVKKREEPK